MARLAAQNIRANHFQRERPELTFVIGLIHRPSVETLGV